LVEPTGVIEGALILRVADDARLVTVLEDATSCAYVHTANKAASKVESIIRVNISSSQT